MTSEPQTVEDLAVYWLQVHGFVHKAASSIKRDHGILKNYILPAFGDTRIETLTTAQIDQWFASLRGRTLAPKSCNEVLGLLKKLLNDAERWGFIDRNPSARVKKLRVNEVEMEFWNLEEVQQYLGYWGSHPEFPRIYWAVVVAIYSGLRRGELIGLKWDCVDLSNDLLTVRRSYCRVEQRVLETTKSRKIRYVPICLALRSFLDRLRPLTMSSGFVLPVIHPDRYHVEFKDSVRRAGARVIRFHDLRHTFASHFMMGGGSLYDLQRILGHSTVQVTERYAHLAPESLRGKTEVLGF